MTTAEWRALIEAYLDGRLSAEAFMRRFIEAWEAGAALPRAIVDLQPLVEAFEAEIAAAREEGAANEDPLRQAARRALANLGEEAMAAPHTFDRTRAREDMRRFQIQMSGCAGMGCVIALALGRALRAADLFRQRMDTGRTGLGRVAFGFRRLLPRLRADSWAMCWRSWAQRKEGWPPMVAALAFFAAPAVTMFSGWSRLRRRS